MKLKISYKKTALTFLFSTLFCGVLIFLVCISIFLDTPWDWRQPVIITVCPQARTPVRKAESAQGNSALPLMRPKR